MELQTKNFHILGNTVWVFNFRLCNKLNRLLGTYGDYKFQDGEEGKFNFTDAQLVKVKIALKVKG